MLVLYVTVTMQVIYDDCAQKYTQNTLKCHKNKLLLIHLHYSTTKQSPHVLK